MASIRMGESWPAARDVAWRLPTLRDSVGHYPRQIIAVWGWGVLPDQYGRRWESDDGERDLPPGHVADDQQVAFRGAGVDVRILRDRIAGDHIAEARPAGNGRRGGRRGPAGQRPGGSRKPARTSRWRSSPTPRLAGGARRRAWSLPATDHQPRWHRGVTVPLPFRCEVLLPWLGLHHHTLSGQPPP
jgi:hypothetical protein